MDIRKMAREELERRQACEDLDPIVYVDDDGDDPDHKPLTPEERRRMRAALDKAGISQIRIIYTDDWRGNA